MAEEALTRLQAQVEAIRREAFAEGYAAAMKKVQEVASQSVPPQSTKPATPNVVKAVQARQSNPSRVSNPGQMTFLPGPATLPVALLRNVARSDGLQQAHAGREAAGRGAAPTPG